MPGRGGVALQARIRTGSSIGTLGECYPLEATEGHVGRQGK
jgi:hypothetical protein